MDSETVTGSCLCGEVQYQVVGNLGIFQYCHCSRCQKFTGSAHAANLFVADTHFHALEQLQCPLLKLECSLFNLTYNVGLSMVQSIDRRTGS